jgi:capsular polysaccharide biosynthesis protein
MIAIIPIIGIALGAVLTMIIIVGALEADTDLSETREDNDGNT